MDWPFFIKSASVILEKCLCKIQSFADSIELHHLGLKKTSYGEEYEFLKALSHKRTQKTMKNPQNHTSIQSSDC